MKGDMEQLWAPWRLAYVSQPKSPKADADCFLCRGLAESDDRANHIVHRSESGCIVLNRYPYSNGHVLIAPLAHKAKLEDLTDRETLDLQKLLSRVMAILDRKMSPEGYNVGLNLGRAAGAGLPGHLHWHLVPRWAGDMNFMPVLADTRILVQSLDALWELLNVEFDSK